MTRVEYRCADGTPFPVVFHDASDVELRWRVDREHAPVAMTPLAAAVRDEGLDGSRRAYDECGLRMPATVARRGPGANGFEYVLDASLPDAELAEYQVGLRRLRERHGDSWGVWARWNLRRVQEACDWLASASIAAPFAELAAWRSYAWSHTSVAGVVARRDVAAVANVIEPLFGERSTYVAYQLAEGYPNDTTEARYLDDGDQTASWPIDQPTLAERPDVLDVQRRLLARGRSPDASARRDALISDVAARLVGDDRATFERRVARLATFIPIREARARWQLLASGAMRGAVRRRGASLFDDADDVFFLLPDEYDDPPADRQSIAAARRAEHRRWLGVVPPASIGAVDDEVGRGAHGRPGSPGRVTGRARVVLDLDDAHRLEPGDILVTVMTSPSWAPLLAVASAVVTDAGDDLSHVAIAAREFGIPCVVGTHTATVSIGDGETITVDGDLGTVERDSTGSRGG